jgi:hypothetical protein
MRFTLKQIRYFDAAVRSGSISRAAAEMVLSEELCLRQGRGWISV